MREKEFVQNPYLVLQADSAMEIFAFAPIRCTISRQIRYLWLTVVITDTFSFFKKAQARHAKGKKNPVIQVVGPSDMF